MIVLDTTVLIYAVSEGHSLREPARRLVDAIDKQAVRATTTAEVIQEFAHVRAGRRTRQDAVRLAESYLDLLSPLLQVTADDVRNGLGLFRRHTRLGSFDAVLAAAASAAGAEALVSADRSFASLEEPRHLDPGTAEFDRYLASLYPAG